MVKKLLAIREIVRGNEVAQREVFNVFDIARDIEGDRALALTFDGFAPWRNGWQSKTADGSTERVSFERCHADQIAATIAAVTV